MLRSYCAGGAVNAPGPPALLEQRGREVAVERSGQLLLLQPGRPAWTIAAVLSNPRTVP